MGNQSQDQDKRSIKQLQWRVKRQFIDDDHTSTRMSHSAFKITTRTPGSSDLYTSTSTLTN